ncbi:MAG: hypothetical protein AAFP02_10060 [Bacteroidota bacterium]
MKYLLPSILLSLVMLTVACEPECDPSKDEFVGDEFFTVEYKNPAGDNYLTSIYNLDEVVVFLDTTGGTDPNPQYELIEPGYKDGKFGPFGFTERYINQARNDVNSALLYGEPFRFDYYFKKDTYGVDTLTVEFTLGVSNCNTFWQTLNYYLNGELLPEYQNQQQAEIVITE